MKNFYKKKLPWALVMFFLCSGLFGQDIEVKGRVIAGDLGEGLPGASVRVKGTSTGQITDADGNFSLTVASDGILIISFTGYIAQEIAVNNRNTINVILQVDVELLEEVIVVGYGTQRKETLVSSVSTAKGEELAKSPQPNLSNSFAGRISGVIATQSSGEPGFDDSQLLIRGLSTNGNNSPLIVIDGIASQLGGLSRLDPNNIESISVLKDAAAAIYGSRAANGVILVTTKSGGDRPAQLSLSYNFGLVTPTRIPEMANSQQYAQILNEIQYYANPAGGLNQVYSAQEVGRFGDGTDPFFYPDTDWLDLVIAPTSTQQQATISVDGGTEDVQYFLSLGARTQESIYRDGITQFEQVNLRTKLNFKVNEDLKIGANLNVRLEEGTYPTTGAGGIFRGAYRGKPIDPAIYPGVGFGVDAEGTAQNPLVLLTGTPGRDEQPRTIFNSILDFDYNLPFARNFNIKGFVAFDKTISERSVFSVPHSVFSAISGTNPVQFNEVTSNVPSPQLFESRSDDNLVTTHLALHYEKTFGDHGLRAFAAYEQSKFTTDFINAFRRGFLSGEVDELNQGPVGVDENGSPFATNGGDSFAESRQNYFGRVSYDYQNKYLAEVQLRYDGSSKFAPGNQFGFFWSASAGWRISEEDFFNIDQINDLKVRASYGVIGNDRIPNFQFLNSYLNAGPGIVVNGVPQTRYLLSQIANEEITWEEAKKLDIGLEATIFKNIKIEVDYFNERRDGLLIAPGDLPWVSGLIDEFGGVSIIPQGNLGIVDNEGFEAQASYTGKVRNVDFFVSANVTYARNEVVQINDPEIIENRRAEGKPLGTGLFYEAIGIFRTPADFDRYPSIAGNILGDLIYRDVNGDGQIDTDDQVRADLTNVPQLVYGVNLGAQWNNFDLSVLLQGQAQSQQYFLPEAGTIGNLTATWAENRYSPTNLTGSYPRAVSRTSASLSGGNGFENTFWLFDTSFLRIRNVEIGYNLPQSVLDRTGLNGIRVYVNGLNLATITGQDDFDPEVTDTQGHGYPQHRIFNFGANIKF